MIAELAAIMINNLRIKPYNISLNLIVAFNFDNRFTENLVYLVKNMNSR